MASDGEVPQITLDRIGPDSDGYEMGTLTVGDTVFSTRERGHGYKNLRIGTYTMLHSIKHTGRHVQCLRPELPAISTILIHDAWHNSVENVTGCIAPGFGDGAGAGWIDSKGAMEKVWELLGGFKEGKKVTLKVETNVSYVPGDQTEEEYLEAL